MSYYLAIKLFATIQEPTCVLQSVFSMTNRMNYTTWNYKKESKDFVIFIIKDVLCSVGLNLIRCSDSMSNKISLQYKKSGFGLIKRYINSCCVTTCLEVAGHFTMIGNYQKALELLDKAEHQIDLHTMVNEKNEATGKFEFSKYDIYKYVTYTRNNVTDIHGGLVYEMYRSTAISPSDVVQSKSNSEAYINIPIYLYYLRLLCFHAIGRRIHRQVALDNMVWAL